MKLLGIFKGRDEPRNRIFKFEKGTKIFLPIKRPKNARKYLPEFLLEAMAEYLEEV